MYRFPAEIGTIPQMPRRFLKRALPDHKKLREMWFMRPFAALLRHPEYWAVRRENVARAFAIGLFVAFIPFPPHSALAPLAALALRANVPVAFATIWITNPFTIVPFFFFAYWLGTVILGVPMSRFSFDLTWDWVSRELPYVWKPLLAGSFVMSVVSAAIGYFGVHWLWRRGVLYRYHRRRRSLERRNSANAQKSVD
jgi:uncharacterized protein (DUF2062 family)